MVSTDPAEAGGMGTGNDGTGRPLNREEILGVLLEAAQQVTCWVEKAQHPSTRFFFLSIFLFFVHHRKSVGRFYVAQVVHHAHTCFLTFQTVSLVRSISLPSPAFRLSAVDVLLLIVTGFSSKVTDWDGKIEESDELAEETGMDSLQTVEFHRIICTQVGGSTVYSPADPSSRHRTCFTASTAGIEFKGEMRDRG